MVPHLVTALTGPINELEQRILESLPATERWFRLEWMEHTPPFYTAVDVRNAGFKLAPVETDLFPTGFATLTDRMLPLAVQAAMAAIEKICPEAKNLLLVPGPDTGEPTFGPNLARLIEIFTQAGLNVRLGSIDPAPAGTIQLPDGTVLRVDPLIRQRGRVGVKDFDPCTILLNHDLAGGVPASLQSLHEQYLLPPLHAGWTVRRRSRHFHAYEEVAKKFAKLLGMDPWLLNPMVAAVGSVDPGSRAGLETLQAQSDALLQKVRRKYKEYGIAEKAFVVVRLDHGHGDGGGVAVRDVKDLGDGVARLAGAGAPVDLIVQEGVSTIERIDDAPAEPVVMMIDRYVVGGGYRLHPGRSGDEPLHGPGARTVPLAFAESGTLPRLGERPGASAPNRFYMYGVVARLAMLAAAYELEATDPDAENYE
ncbi:MAG: glutamate--cysteine ligase [Ideonella sp.]|jgi:glutamate--cysteine ligase|nr:glutamate--cysteine ligase [Ideonella sp.]